ncbi:hypothetical protein [Maricaulis sp.]|uniref:hypothetical protein n=1 Tax=Maricaulis sp. TaxID=1486257 RepID=UPI0032975857
MPDERKEGIAAAIDATGPGELPVLGELVGELFDLDPVMRSPRRKADAASGDKRGPGRPKGSKNKRSQDWVAYLGAQYTLPLEGLVALGDMAPEELLRDLADQAERLTGRKVDFTKMKDDEILGRLERCLAIINDARKSASPYMHERRGMVVADDQGNDVPVLGIFAAGGTPAIGQAREVLGFDTRPRDVREENQALIEGNAGKSSDGKSSPDAKSLNNNDETPE